VGSVPEFGAALAAAPTPPLGPGAGYGAAGGYPAYPYAPLPDQRGKATAALVLGIIGLVAWCLPLAGLPVTIVGLVMGIKGRRSARASMATAAIVLCILGLVASIVNAIVGAYLAATGRHGLVNLFQQ
jgi:hypothetical protein